MLGLRGLAPPPFGEKEHLSLRKLKPCVFLESGYHRVEDVADLIRVILLGCLLETDVVMRMTDHMDCDEIFGICMLIIGVFDCLGGLRDGRGLVRL